MMSNRLSLLLRQVYRGSAWNCRLCSTVPETGYDKDPAPLFFNERIQELLITLTRLDYDKVFAARKDGTPLTTPMFKFMTEEELKEAKAEIEKKARGRIQMPPVVMPREDTNLTLSKDIAIQGFSDTNYVFTDISFGSNNRDRLIVVREPSGTLRHAKCNERHRMNQIYFPIKGREMYIPKMFSNPYFNDLLEKQKFEFILDRACLQFEPDDPEYQRITRIVYYYVNKWKVYDALRSTRHFGPMVFQLAWEKQIDDLLEDVLKNEKIEEANALVQVYCILHRNTESGEEPMTTGPELIKYYAETYSSDRYKIMRALDNYLYVQEERKQLKKGKQETNSEPVKETNEPET